MIHSYSKRQGKIAEFNGLKEGALWYDLFKISETEKKEIENLLKIYIPSQEKMGKIGASNTFFKKGEVLYMTISVIAKKSHSDQLSLFPITFIMHPNCLISLRYAEPKPFQIFKQQFFEDGEKWNSPQDIFLGLLATIFNRIAERIEIINLDMDDLSKEIFLEHRNKKKRTTQLNDILTQLGKKGDLAAKLNESSRTFERMLHYFNLQKKNQENPEMMHLIAIVQQDITSIFDHLTFLSHKINFLLEACLGYITVEQNKTIQLFTIMAVIFLPPALVASIYGMNFQYMPELSWHIGYPFALVVIIASAIFPYFYFKKKGWL